MKLLENAFVQSDSQTLVESDKVKIEIVKLAEDLSMATITVHAEQEYAFTARSGVVTTQVGTGTISTPTESFDLNLFDKIALERNERVTITNNQTFPLVLNFIQSN